MSITSLSLVGALRDRMQWHGVRQRVLAENVANADTPGFKPQELRAPNPTGAASGGGITLASTNPLHLGLSGGASGAPGSVAAERFETRPSGNAVSLETEMMKVADNQSDFQLAATLYQRSLSLLKTAAGGRSS